MDSVLPRVPVRQWVLTVPHGLRYRMAHDPSLTTAVPSVLMRAVSGWLRRRARKLRIAGPAKTWVNNCLVASRGRWHARRRQQLLKVGVYHCDRGTCRARVKNLHLYMKQ